MLFVRVTVSGLRVFVAVFAVLVRCGSVFLRVVVLAHIVKMRRLKVMMSGRLMVSSSLKMMPARGVL